LSSEALHLVRTREGALRISIAAKPRARTSRIVGLRDGALVVQLAAPPADGAANAELISLLAAALDLAKSDVAIVRGESSRFKVVELCGLAEDEARERLARHLR
jgi:uncharacterized protein (TIGR00251 family)